MPSSLTARFTWPFSGKDMVGSIGNFQKQISILEFTNPFRAMFNFQHLYLFFIASLLLNLTPGNDMLYVASRSVSQGVKAGIVSATGVFTGCFIHITAA